jgi:hypothetical protein
VQRWDEVGRVVSELLVVPGFEVALELAGSGLVVAVGGEAIDRDGSHGVHNLYGRQERFHDSKLRRAPQRIIPGGEIVPGQSRFVVL